MIRLNFANEHFNHQFASAQALRRVGQSMCATLRVWLSKTQPCRAPGLPLQRGAFAWLRLLQRLQTSLVWSQLRLQAHVQAFGDGVVHNQFLCLDRSSKAVVCLRASLS